MQLIHQPRSGHPSFPFESKRKALAFVGRVLSNISSKRDCFTEITNLPKYYCSLFIILLKSYICAHFKMQ